MSKKKEEKLSLDIGEPLKEKPSSIRGKTQTSKEYDDLIQAVLKKEKGCWYPIIIKGRKMATVKQAMIGRIGTNKKPTELTKKLCVHEVKNTLYIEVL